MILVYLLMVVNFQSWLDPFIIITALPAALGRNCLDALRHAHDSERSFLDGRDHVHRRGYLQQHFAGDLCHRRTQGRQEFRGRSARAGFMRLRPVIMTALAMIIGMLPMALGIGEGAEQNAPLGRAVIGGLLIATVATLFFVPVVFSYLHRKGYHRLATEEGEPEMAR